MAVDYTFSGNITADATLATLGRQPVIEFCPNPADKLKDQICIASTFDDTTIIFRQRNPATGLFDSSSATQSTGLAAAAFWIQYAPHPTDRAKDTVFFQYSSTTISWITRNPATGLFDATAFAGTYTSPNNLGAAIFTPHPTDLLKDQYIFNDITTAPKYVLRDSVTGLFNFSSVLSISAMAAVGANGFSQGAYGTFLPSSINYLNDQITFARSGSFSTTLIKRNSTTQVFDSASTTASLNTGNSGMGFMKAIFIANQADENKDQFVVVSGSTLRSVYFIFQRNAATGIFDSSTGRLDFSSATNVGTACFLKSTSVQSDALLIVDATNASNTVFDRNPATGLMDSGSRMYLVPETVSASRNKCILTPGITADKAQVFLLPSGTATTGTLQTYLPGKQRVVLSQLNPFTINKNPGFDSGLNFVAGGISLSSVVTWFQFDSYVSLAAKFNDDIDFVRAENTLATLQGNLSFSGIGKIEGDFAITIGANKTLNLSTSTRTTFTERVTLSPTSTVIIGNSINVEPFTHAAGTAVNADDGIGPYTYTVSQDPGLVAGPGVTIASPELTLTITGIPAGGIFTIWDDEIADPQDLGTALQTTNPTDGGGIPYQGSAGNAVIFQFVPNTGDSAIYQEFNTPGVIPATSQTLDLSSSLELEVNL